MAAPPQPSLANKITPPGGSDGWDINFNDLENLQDLSSGNFGKVYRGTYFGTEVAVKKLLDIEDEFMHKYIEREMAILKYVLRLTTALLQLA
jgi:serine/threonine protein kinase